MSEKPELKKALKESNAIGWIAFFGLVVAIGVGTIMFGGAPETKQAAKEPASTSGSSNGLNYLK